MCLRRGKGSRALLKRLKQGVLVHDASYYTAVQLEGPEVVYFSFSFSFFVGIFFFFIVIHLSLKDILNWCSDSNILKCMHQIIIAGWDGLILLVLFKALLYTGFINVSIKNGAGTLSGSNTTSWKSWWLCSLQCNLWKSNGRWPVADSSNCLVGLIKLN